VNNPLFILQTLDRHLDHTVELTLYGRAAIALGYPAHESRHETTQDADAIIPLGQLDELAKSNLYITHLFTETDVFLQPDWMNRRVPIQRGFVHLKVFRPATIDLILTKMMRGADPEDLSDVEFLLKMEPVPPAELKTAFERVRMPAIQELHDAFRAAQPKVLALAKAKFP
jgi:hypothetical protein